jgi:hypothetical protein
MLIYHTACVRIPSPLPKFSVLFVTVVLVVRENLNVRITTSIHFGFGVGGSRKVNVKIFGMINDHCT